MDELYDVLKMVIITICFAGDPFSSPQGILSLSRLILKVLCS